jgi:hypothetical protein
MKESKEQDEEKSGSDDIHLDWMKVIHSFSYYILPAEESGACDKVLECIEPFSFNMGDVVKEMVAQVQERIVRIDIFLAARMAIISKQFCFAIKTNAAFFLF